MCGCESSSTRKIRLPKHHVAFDGDDEIRRPIFIRRDIQRHHENGTNDYTLNLPDDSDIRFYMPVGTTFQIVEDDYSSQGYDTYWQWKHQIVRGNTSDPITLSSNESFYFINCKQPYIRYDVYTYANVVYSDDKNTTLLSDYGMGTGKVWGPTVTRPGYWPLG